MSGDVLDRRKIRRLVDEFTEAWQAGSAPLIESVLPPRPAWGGSPARQELLEELVQVEMEYRWRGGRPVEAGRPKLEEYLERFPELGRPERVSIALIGAEYRIRHLWGDRPGFEEYPGRFRGRGSEIRAVFAKMEIAIAAALLAETGPPPAPPRPSTVPLTNVAGLLDALRTHQLLDVPKLNELIAADLQGRLGDLRAATGRLVQEDWLTPFQANQILQGRAAELVMGSYVLLGRFSQSLTGQVYKALHRNMQRVVALKVIRPELMTDEEAVTRFYREMNVVGRLDHPNIVHAFDAGPVGNTHILVMEYLEGKTFAELVKKSGPLPAAQACDYARQVALGLQHAHEKNLVHRDIKPQNLFLVEYDTRHAAGGSAPAGAAPAGQASSPSKFGLVKILDMGVARLQAGGDADWSSLVRSQDEGAQAGDYLAPERALDSQAVDIRADVYSLGCVLFFLLTGRPPFAGGTIAEKLLKHQQAVPPQVAAHRRDVSPQVDAVLSKMMAKRPADRYATPGELAAVLVRVPT